MQLILSEDQAMLARTAREYLSARGQVAALRKLRDSKDERAYSPETYAGLAELGFTGIVHAEADGGSGLGLAELVLVTEAMGRCLSPEPLIPSSVLAGRCLSLLGDSEQKAQWLAPLIAGNKVLALAHSSPQSRFELARVPVRAERTSAGYPLPSWGCWPSSSCMVRAASPRTS
jgi:alkylation response protein AidB-like acyl-CoA dehydrogenase